MLISGKRISLTESENEFIAGALDCDIQYLRNLKSFDELNQFMIGEITNLNSNQNKTPEDKLLIKLVENFQKKIIEQFYDTTSM